MIVITSSLLSITAASAAQLWSWELGARSWLHWWTIWYWVEPGAVKITSQNIQCSATDKQF